MQSHDWSTEGRDCARMTWSSRAIRWLLGSYVVLSVLTVAAIAIFSGLAPQLVNSEAWFRGVIVAATSILTFLFAVRAARGDNPRWLLRLRIIVVIILAAIVAVLFFLPLPRWMIVEQAICGLLLLGAALIIFGRGARSLGCEEQAH